MWLSRLVWTWTPEVSKIRKVAFKSSMEQRRNEVPKEWTMEIGKAGIEKEE